MAICTWLVKQDRIAILGLKKKKISEPARQIRPKQQTENGKRAWYL